MSFDNIKLEKGLYTTGKSFTDALESIDPSENYKGTSLEGLDAYERQLKRFDIKVSGNNSDCISKFFATTDSAALFPEYISRAVSTGVEINNTVNDVVATVTNIDSLDYRSIYVTNNNEDYYVELTSEGGELPEIKITLDSKLTELKKYGKMISASYEAIKYQKLDLFTTILKRIGTSIAYKEFIDAVNIISGSDIEVVSKVGTTLCYQDLVALWSNCQPFTMNTLICTTKVLPELLSIPEFRDSNAGLTFHGNGQIGTLMGANMIVVPKDVNAIIGFDKNYAVEKVQVGGVMTEFDKLIDRQLERATVSTITGFNAIYKDSISMLEV